MPSLLWSPSLCIDAPHWMWWLASRSNKIKHQNFYCCGFLCISLLSKSNDLNIVFKLRKLTQQYVVDQWAKIEDSRLELVRRNQKSIRAEKYQGLMDAASSNDHVNVGMKFVLPATVYGSTRFYSEAFPGAMSIVRNLSSQTYLFLSSVIRNGLKWNQLWIQESKHVTAWLVLQSL